MSWIEKKAAKVKELDAEFAELLTKKEASYPDYRKARNDAKNWFGQRKTWNDFCGRKRTPSKKCRPDK